MAMVKQTVPCLLVCAQFSQEESLLNWTRERMERFLGPVELESKPFEFNQTSYYNKEMGENLLKRLVVFQDLVDPAKLADIKLLTNQIEQEALSANLSSQERPVNLDPGLLNLGKFMLATTKDQAHRIYLRDGIFAEVTLHYQGTEFVLWPWTYADYRTDHVREFLKQARDLYRTKLKAWQGSQNES